MEPDSIQIHGAREHNLKNLSLKLPRNRLTVITGLSGSGKSSLAFDTLYAEGQRRYLESLSSYARQFLEKMKKPDVDQITGLSPAIAIEQRSVAHNPRSTVGTVTEIFDYLRLLFAKAGEVFCYRCGRPLAGGKPAQIRAQILEQFSGEAIYVLAPVVRGRKGEFQKLFQMAAQKGYGRARVDGRWLEIDKKTKLRKTKRHDIEILVDSVVVRRTEEKRLAEALRRALELAGGDLAVVSPKDPKGERRFSTQRMCVRCKVTVPELAPNLFSFNSPYGACPRCKGMGRLSQLLSQGVVRDETRPIFQGALNEEIFFSFNKYVIEDLVEDLREKHRFDLRLPFRDWPEAAREAFFWGDEDLLGLLGELEDLFHRTPSEEVKRKIRKFLREEVCPECRGGRIRKENLGVRIGGHHIVEWSGLSIEEMGRRFGRLSFPEGRRKITDPILHEIRERLHFLENVGLGYLTLDRSVATLAGGELQRIRLAAQIGVGLSGVLYVLDEPSIGLHPRDNARLLDTLEALRDLKNTVLVVEHDEETIRRADHVVDLGPGAGREGGELVGEGTLGDLSTASQSLTGRYLTGGLKIPLPEKRKDWRQAPVLAILGCQENNLKKIDVRLPLGLFICVTGVSGSGKSTLVHDILFKELHNRLWKTHYRVGKFRTLRGAEKIDQVVEIDQSPIGRTPRSNPATYTDLFGLVRHLFAQTQEARMRSFSASRFSFNLKGGRCETCRGEGYEKLQMSFMPDLYVTCEKCRGRRYNDPTLEVKYKGKSIAEVLELSVTEAIEFFSGISLIREKLQLLKTIGLGYLKLGQPSNTLSGGEAQRIKLGSELTRRSTGRTLYLLDEPTTGLHFADIQNLLKALIQLRELGNTVLVVEHNLEVVKTADFILDLGPEGGQRGGQIVAQGSPEEVAKNRRSHTGRYLQRYLALLMIGLSAFAGVLSATETSSNYQAAKNEFEVYVPVTDALAARPQVFEEDELDFTELGRVTRLEAVETDSEPAETRKKKDAKPPTGSIVINQGERETAKRTVRLTITGSDSGSGLGKMRFSTNGGNSWTAWEGFSRSKTLTLSQGVGRREVFMQLRDREDNVATFKDTIYLTHPHIEAAFSYFASGSNRNKAIESTSGYPFEGYNSKTVRRYTQPTNIGFYALLLANVIAGEIKSEHLSVNDAKKDLLKMMNSLVKDQARLGFKGLMPWISFRNGSWQRDGGDPGKRVMFGDNANLSAALGTAMGALSRGGLNGDTTVQKIKSKIETFLTRQESGYEFLYDSSEGKFRQGWNFVRGFWEGAYHDYFGDEFRSGILFVTLEYGFPTSAYEGLDVRIEDYKASDGRTLFTVAPQDGGAFQMLWPTLTMPEIYNPALSRMLKDYVDIALDFSERKKLPGFLSASYTGIDEYGGNVGIADIAVNARNRNQKVASLYTLGAAHMVDPKRIDAFLDEIFEDHPGLRTSHGFWEGIDEKGRVIKEQIVANVTTFLLGLIGKGPEQMTRYLKQKGLYSRFQEIYRKGVVRDLIQESTNAFTWGDEASGRKVGSDQYEMTVSNFGSQDTAYTAFIQNDVSLSGRKLVIRYRSNMDIKNAKLEFKKCPSGNCAQDQRAAVQINHLSFKNTGGREAKIEVNLPVTPALSGVDELVLVAFGGSGKSLKLRLTGLEAK